jgi:hypothetical protein
MKIVNRILIALLLATVPLAANATVRSGQIATVCAGTDPACTYYAMGAAERFWLVHSNHASCDAAADKKSLDMLVAAIHGKSNLFTTVDKPTVPAAIAVLGFLNEKKLESCALNTRFSDLVGKCASKDGADQNVCHAYVAGVIDMALAMDEIHQSLTAKTPDAAMVSPFCEAGKPKGSMTDSEIMQTIAGWNHDHAAETTTVPASAGIIDALLTKYPCPKNDAGKPDTAKPAGNFTNLSAPKAAAQ